MADRLRLTGPSKPYTIAIKNFADVPIYTATTSDEEYNLPDLPGGLIIQITNAINETRILRRDSVTRTLLRKYHVGPSVANGNFSNHKEAIDRAAERGFTYVGCVYHQDDVEDDAALNALGASVFDHTVAPSGGVYAKGFDEVVRKAYLTNPSDLSKRVTLRVGIHLGRENNKLNNGTTRTLFYGEDAMSKRPNGELTYKAVDGPVPSIMIPSYASTEFTNFARRILLNFMKRYLPAINDGTIMSIGLLTGTTGESEYIADMRNTSNGTDGPSQGDFHTEMIAGFKAKFPQHVGESNNNIANNDLNNSVLGKNWTWWLSERLRQFEQDKIDYVTQNLVGFTRTQWFQIDCGSMTDGLAPRRRTFNIFPRLNPAVIMVKVNDEPFTDNNRNKFVAEHLSSVSRKFGGIAIIEPSPTGGDFSPSSPMRPYIMNQTIAAREFGVGISFVTSNYSDIDWLANGAGLKTPVITPYKNEFRTVGTSKITNRLEYNLSDIYSTNSTSGLQVAYTNYLAANGVTRADIRIVDNVDPLYSQGGGGGGVDYTAITNYLNSNLGAYGGNILFNIKKASGNVFTYTQGSYNRDQLLSVASLSKAVTAATLLAVIEDGDLSLTTTVGSLIPSWNSGARANITLRQIIGHTSGIPDSTVDDSDNSISLATYVNNLAGVALNFTPGTQFSYSTTSYQVAARMAEIAKGQTWKQIFEDKIRNKCSMGSAIYNPGAPYQAVTGNPNNPLAGYGLWVSQNAHSNFFQMIRENGVYNGTTVLSPASITLLTTTDATGGLGSWAFGMIRNNSNNEPTSESALGCYAWVNKAKGYSAVLFTQDDYASTIGSNNGLRDIVRNTL